LQYGFCGVFLIVIIVFLAIMPHFLFNVVVLLDVLKDVHTGCVALRCGVLRYVATKTTQHAVRRRVARHRNASDVNEP